MRSSSEGPLLSVGRGSTWAIVEIGKGNGPQSREVGEVEPVGAMAKASCFRWRNLPHIRSLLDPDVSKVRGGKGLLNHRLGSKEVRGLTSTPSARCWVGTSPLCGGSSGTTRGL